MFIHVVAPASEGGQIKFGTDFPDMTGTAALILQKGATLPGNLSRDDLIDQLEEDRDPRTTTLLRAELISTYRRIMRYLGRDKEIPRELHTEMREQIMIHWTCSTEVIGEPPRQNTDLIKRMEDAGMIGLLQIPESPEQEPRCGFGFPPEDDEPLELTPGQPIDGAQRNQTALNRAERRRRFRRSPQRN